MGDKAVGPVGSPEKDSTTYRFSALAAEAASRSTQRRFKPSCEVDVHEVRGDHEGSAHAKATPLCGGGFHFRCQLPVPRCCAAAGHRHLEDLYIPVGVRLFNLSESTPPGTDSAGHISPLAFPSHPLCVCVCVHVRPDGTAFHSQHAEISAHVGVVRLAELCVLCDSCRSFASLEASTPEEALAALTEGMKRRAALAEVFSELGFSCFSLACLWGITCSEARRPLGQT